MWSDNLYSSSDSRIPSVTFHSWVGLQLSERVLYMLRNDEQWSSVFQSDWKGLKLPSVIIKRDILTIYWYPPYEYDMEFYEVMYMDW